jgi:hypothetical protein
MSTKLMTTLAALLLASAVSAPASAKPNQCSASGRANCLSLSCSVADLSHGQRLVGPTVPMACRQAA